MRPGSCAIDFDLKRVPDCRRRHTGDRRRATRVAVAVFAIVVGAMPARDGGATGRDAPPDGDPALLEARRSELKARVEAAQRELAAAESSRADAADALRASALAISEANRRLRELEAERRTVTAALARLDAEQASLSEAVRAEQTLLARLLARQRRGSEYDPLKLLLSGRDPSAIGRLLHYYQVISDARARSIAGLRADLARAQALAASIVEQQERLDVFAKQEEAQRATLERERREQSQALTKVATDVRRQRSELDHLRRDEARLARLLERLADIARSLPPSPAPAAVPGGTAASVPRSPAAASPSGEKPGAAVASGRFRAAAAMPVRGELTRRFGAPRQGGGTASKGWFIRCARGEEVRAIAAGQVVFADWLRGFGNLLILDHGDGYMSLYGNNDALLATVGAMVRPGEAIAQAGASGGSAELGLYFEIRHQGKAVDPAGWIGQ